MTARRETRFDLLRYFLIVGLTLNVLFIAVAAWALNTVAGRGILDATVYTGVSLARLQQSVLFPAGSPQPLARAVNEPAFRATLDGVLRDTPVLKVKVWDPDGRVVYSTDPAATGTYDPEDPGLRAALLGQVHSELEEGEAHPGEDVPTRVVEVYVPIRNSPGEVRGAYEIYLPVDRALEEVTHVGVRAVIFVALALLGLQFAALLAVVYQGHRMIGQSQEVLERSQRLATIGQFGAGIGHELRAPLGVISNALYVLRGRLKDNPDQRVQRNLELIEREVRRSDSTIGALMSLARLKPPQRTRLDLSEVVTGVTQGLDLPAGVRLELSLGAGGELTVDGDRAQLEQLLRNLAANAVEAMPQGGTLSVTTRRGEREAILEVRDTGVGMDEDQRRAIFEPLVTGKATGTGLGLALVRAIVEAHGGRIEVASRPGRGSTFTVHLPASG